MTRLSFVCPVSLVLLLACAAESESDGTETETETETDATGSSSTDVTATVSATGATAGMTAGSNSNSGGSNPETSATVTSSVDETMGNDTTASPESEGSTADDGPCVPGTLGCPCDVGSTCEDPLLCIDGTCLESAPCDVRGGEPNDDEASAVDLGMATCGEDAMTTMGGLEGEDIDWFVYALEPADFCFGQSPNAEVDAGDDVEVEVCMFAICAMGDANVGCFGGGLEDAESPDGVPGCCGTNSVSLPQAACGITQAAPASVEVRLTGGAADACTPYELTWAY